MIERVAYALDKATEVALATHGRFDTQQMARIAIEAMREPTKEQAICGRDALDDCVDSDWSSDADGNRHDYTIISSSAPAQVYRAMIDAALK